MKKSLIVLTIVLFVFASIEAFGAIKKGEVPAGYNQGEAPDILSKKDRKKAEKGIFPKYADILVCFEDGWEDRKIKKGNKVLYLENNIGIYKYVRVKKKWRLFYMTENGTKLDPNAPVTQEGVIQLIESSNHDLSKQTKGMIKDAEKHSIKNNSEISLSLHASKSVISTTITEKILTDMLEYVRKIKSLQGHQISLEYDKLE